MKPLFKLICKGLLVLLPLFALIFLFSHTQPSFVSGDAVQMLWLKDAINEPQEKYYDTIILGDSVANASYLPEVLSDGVMNLAVANLAPVGCYYTLLNWLEYNEAPRTCYLSFQDTHLRDLGAFWEASAYAHTFPFRQNLEVIKTVAESNGKSIWRSEDTLRLLSYTLWLPKQYIASFLNASFNQRYADNMAAWTLRDLHAGHYIGVTTKEYEPSETKTFETFYTAGPGEGYYRKLIELCRANDIQVRIVRLSLPENWILPDTYTETFNAYYDELKAAYPGVTVDRFPIAPNEYFIDECHMNSYGALRFCTELKKMYPEDFGNEPLSADQVAGLNDYITKEVSLSHLFDWTAGSDYTVILYDRKGLFEQLYGGMIQPVTTDLPLTVRRAEGAQAPEGESVLYVSGTDESETGFTVYHAEDGKLMLQLTDGEPKEWTLPADADLGAVVVDNYNNNVIFMKSFRYVDAIDATFALAA